MGQFQSSEMPDSVDIIRVLSSSSSSSSSYSVHIPSMAEKESSVLPTLTSGYSDESSSSDTREPHPSDTSYGLSSLEADAEKLEEFIKLREDDVNFIVAARAFFESEQVFRKKFKIRATRRLQINVRSRAGYTKLRREFVRRLPRQKKDVPSLATAFGQLNLRPERPFQSHAENILARLESDYDSEA